jgi:hypothetical protein
MKPHGNSLVNQNLHHLYEIFRIANGILINMVLLMIQS